MAVDLVCAAKKIASYPRSWHPAATTLTPVLVDPVVPIALGTYRLEPQRLAGLSCPLQPRTAYRTFSPYSRLA